MFLADKSDCPDIFRYMILGSLIFVFIVNVIVDSSLIQFGLALVLLCIYHTYLVATSQTTKEHIKATYLIEPNPHQKKSFVNFWNLYCQGKDSHVCKLMPPFISKWLLFMKYNTGKGTAAAFVTDNAEVNLQDRYADQLSVDAEDNSSRITTGGDALQLDPEQQLMFSGPQMTGVQLHQHSDQALGDMQLVLDDGRSGSQATSRSITFAVDGPQFEGNMDSFNQRIELTAMSYDYVNIIPMNNSSNSGESKES